MLLPSGDTCDPAHTTVEHANDIISHQRYAEMVAFWDATLGSPTQASFL